jgi:hypothetical protein
MGRRSTTTPTFEWPLETIIYYVWRPLLFFCPFQFVIETGWLFKTDRAKELARAAWVIAWTFGLIVLWKFSPVAAWFCVALALVRLYEIYITGIGTILNQRSMARARNVATIVLYVIQAIFIFAILGQGLESGGFIAEPVTHASREVASKPVDFLYISWTNLTSLGNDFHAQTNFGRFLEVFATTTGIFLLSVLLAFGIEEAKKPHVD